MDGLILYIFVTGLVIFMGYFINSSYRKNKMIENGVDISTSVISRQELLNKVLLFGIFMILFSLSALRVGIGNDYWTYRFNFITIAEGETPVSYEIGFKFTVLLMQRLFGLDNYRTTFALMAFVTCAFSLKAMYDTADWFAYTLFIFMANGFYFMSFSTVRYYFALAVCIYSMKYVFSKKYVPFVLWVLFAALFHKTALLVIPAYIVAYYLKWTKKTIWMIPTASAILFLGKKVIRWLLFKIYPFYEGDAILDAQEVSYVNIAKCFAILIMCLILYKETIKDNPKAEMLFNLNLFALLLYTFGSYVPELSRICYYMVIGQIFLIPMVLLGIKDRKKKIFWMTSVSLAYVLYFIVFLIRGRSDYVMILPYLTWVFI